MKVLSILQPWASLIVTGHKLIETRSWNTKYRGEILIHASKKLTKEQMIIGQEFNRKFGAELGFIDDLPLGAIIGKVKLVATASTNYIIPIAVNNEPTIVGDGILSFLHLTEREFEFGDYSEDRYGWLLADAVEFEKPINAKGRLGFWNYENDNILSTFNR